MAKKLTLTEETVLQMLDDFTQAWNQGDMEGACEVYAHEASFVGKFGYIRGKDKILERYREAFPDQASMGVLTLELLEYRPSVTTLNNVTMATAILRWSTRGQDDSEKSGFALETYQLRCNKVVIVQDATIMGEDPDAHQDAINESIQLANMLDAGGAFLDVCMEHDYVNWRLPVVARKYTAAEVLHKGAAFIRRFAK